MEARSSAAKTIEPLSSLSFSSDAPWTFRKCSIIGIPVSVYLVIYLCEYLLTSLISIDVNCSLLFIVMFLFFPVWFTTIYLYRIYSLTRICVYPPIDKNTTDLCLLNDSIYPLLNKTLLKKEKTNTDIIWHPLPNNPSIKGKTRKKNCHPVHLAPGDFHYVAHVKPTKQIR